MFGGPHLMTEVASVLAGSGVGCAQHAYMHGPFGIHVHSLSCHENVEPLLDHWVQEGAKIFIRFNNLLPDNYEAVKAIARRAVLKQKPTFADVLENAAATVGPGGHWDRAMA